MFRTIRLKRVIGWIGLGIIIVIIGIWCIFPFIWMLSTAFKNPAEIFSQSPVIFPKELYVDNFTYLWQHTSFLSSYFWNTIIIASLSAVVCTATAVLAGYSCSRFDFNGKNTFLLTLLVTQMLPHSLLLIPIFSMMIRLGLLNSRISVIIVYSVFSLPLCTWMLKNYFDSIPQELEEAALVDGCNKITSLIHIIMPLAGSGLVAVFLFSFIFGWQEFIFALTLLRKAEFWTLSVGISLFLGQFVTLWGALMAGGVVFTLPVIAVFIGLRKYLVQSMLSGAVKG